MTEKKTIALVHATFNAVNPMTDYMRRHASEYQIVNYLDGFLMDKIRKEGKISDSSVGRMLHMLSTACQDGADGIIMTCTIFSGHEPYFSRIFSAPIICPDGAMHDTVAKMGGKTAIICTFEGTVETTRNQYYEYCRKNAMPQQVDMYTVSEAFEAIQSGDTEKCNDLVQKKVYELDEGYDQIILAQISMASAAEGLETKHAKVFTSPSSALAEIKRLMGVDNDHDRK